jgi:CheY-like chemotaxis protein
MIVAITGRNRPEDKQMAELAGFDHHFAKPFEPRALLATLDSLLR